MSELRFEDSYQFLEHNYGSKNRNGQRITNKILKLTPLLDNQQAEDLISVHFPKYTIGRNLQELFFSLCRLKYLSIIQPICCFNEDSHYILVYQDYLKYQLTQNKFHELIQEKKGYRILLQLTLAFAELDKRKYPWPLIYLEDLYYIDGLIFLSLGDYDFIQLNQFNSCYQTYCIFVRQYFCNLFQEIDGLLRKNSFEVIINYLLEKEGNMQIINHLNPPYENVLIYLLQIKKLLTIHQAGNSVVKVFDTPNIFKQLFGKLKEQIVYKSTKFQSEEVKQQILTNMNREIELMEKFNDQSYMAVCFSYFRIGDYSFLLQKKYVGTLADALKTWKPSTIQQQQKDVYTFSQRFANALKEMHKFNIIHRDLKPENLFFDSLELTTSWVYIADFDRSKQLKENQTQNSMLNTLNGACTPKYDPPEENQTLQYDVFQYGLIVLTVANKGTYVGNESGPRMMNSEQYQKFYGPQAIRNILAKYNYKEEFLQIIIQCLNIDPQYRPNANQTYDVMNKLSYKAKIVIIPQSPSSESPVRYDSNSNTPLSFDSANNINETNSQQQASQQPRFVPPPQQVAPIFRPNQNYNQFQNQQVQQISTPQTPNPNQPIQRQSTFPQTNQNNVYTKIRIISEQTSQQQPNRQTPN